MKRDMDLIRSILLLTESTSAGELVRDFSSLGTHDHTIAEHAWLAEQSGLIEARFLGDSPSNGAVIILRLTPAGHDFLEQAREPTRWIEAKETVKKAGAGLTVEVLKTVLSHLTTVAITAALAAPK